MKAILHRKVVPTPLERVTLELEPFEALVLKYLADSIGGGYERPLHLSPSGNLTRVGGWKVREIMSELHNQLEGV